jgi:hypothetical protein
MKKAQGNSRLPALGNESLWGSFQEKTLLFDLILSIKNDFE